MFSRVKKWFSGRSAEPGRMEEAQTGLDICPVAASSQVRAFTLDEFFMLLMQNRLHEEEERGAGGDTAAASPASSGGLDAEGPPSPETPPPVSRQWRWRPQPTGRGRPTGLRKILLRIKKLCCLGVRDQETELDVEEEELTDSLVADSFQRLSTLNEFLHYLLQQVEQLEGDQHADGDAKKQLPSTSAAVPIGSDISSEPPQTASHFRTGRRRRRQGRAGQQAAHLSSRRSYRLFSRHQL